MTKKKQIIEMEKATLSTVPFDKAKYFSFAEGGAMGEMGGVLMVTSDGEVYHANHCFGDISYDDLVAVFPPLGKCSFRMFGEGSTTPKGWNDVDLGMGNHLIVHDDVYPAFKKKVKGLIPPQIYQKWVKIATTQPMAATKKGAENEDNYNPGVVDRWTTDGLGIVVLNPKDKNN